MNPKVTVLLPVYNGAHTLHDAVKSIVNQSFSDWELLIIDNNSCDASARLAKEWVAKETRIRFLHEPKQGIAFALNYGLSEARGKYIARMDADDWSHPDRLAKQTQYLEENPTIDVVSCQTTFRSSVPKSGGYRRFVDWQNSLITPQDHFINRFAESPVAHPSVMFRRSLIDELGHYSIEIVPEDYELWLRWMAAGKRFYKIAEPLLTWHDHESRLSRTNDHYSEEAFFKVKAKYLRLWLAVTSQTNKNIVACGTSKECRERVNWLSADGIDIHYLTDITRKDPAAFSFIPHEEIDDPLRWIVINLIGKRGVREDILSYFQGKGFTLGKNLLSLI